jgi:hypothetical protein
MNSKHKRTDKRPNKKLQTNGRPALDLGLSSRLFDTVRSHHVAVRVAVSDLAR